MSHPLRITYPGAVYHVMNWGTARQAVFSDSADYELFLQVLADCHAQSLIAQRDMQKAKKEGKTCIDCNKGVAHKLPKGYESDSVVYEEDLKKL